MIVAHAFELVARLLWAIGFALGDVARGVDRVEVAIASVADRLLDGGHAAGDFACAIAEVMEDTPVPLSPLDLALEHLLGVPSARVVIWADRQHAAAAFLELAERAGRRRDVVVRRAWHELRYNGGRLQVLVRDRDTADGVEPTLEVQL